MSDKITITLDMDQVVKIQNLNKKLLLQFCDKVALLQGIIDQPTESLSPGAVRGCAEILSEILYKWKDLESWAMWPVMKQLPNFSTIVEEKGWAPVDEGDHYEKTRQVVQGFLSETGLSCYWSKVWLDLENNNRDFSAWRRAKKAPRLQSKEGGAKVIQFSAHNSKEQVAPPKKTRSTRKTGPA